MKFFGNKKYGDDPVPKHVQLMGKKKEEPNIVLSKLTEEIIRQDLTTIRDIFDELDKHLATVAGFGEYLRDIESLVIKFGKAYDHLIVKINASSEQVKLSNERQETNQKQIINTQNKLVESQNQIIGLLNDFFKSNNQPDQVGQISQIKLIDLSEAPKSATSNKPNRMESIQESSSNSRSNQNISQNKSCTIQELKSTANNNKSNFAESNSSALQSVNPNFPAEKTLQILEEIKKTIVDINFENLPVEYRNAENLRGMQVGNLWFIALPPNPDGSYDPQNLLEDSFEKIKKALSKSNATIAIAVYDGEIKNKHIGAAKSVATDLKFTLTSAL